MADLNQASDFLTATGEKPKIPSGINVLTILTFIGCAIGLLGSVYNFANAKSGLDKMEAAINSPDYENMPAMAKKFMNPEALEIARKSYENRIPITVIGFIGIGLCLYGAIQMRQLKKQGYYMYLAGEILPFIPSVIFLGIGSLTGLTGIIAICITLLFVILYSAQSKYLTN
ncbi:MAG TPA: hypothetical protein VKI61_14360 [Chitinophagaceae bacterium]|jgi:hypothetical protein|nr:hypothetical protein [Chitinophagaceae bacterium]